MYNVLLFEHMIEFARDKPQFHNYSMIRFYHSSLIITCVGTCINDASQHTVSYARKRAYEHVSSYCLTFNSACCDARAKTMSSALMEESKGTHSNFY